MIDSIALRWILSLTFAAIGMCYLARCVQTTSAWTQRISCVAHLAMSAAMIAMVWPWGMNIPVRPQVAVFALAAVWFLVLAWSREHRSIRPHELHHVVIMAATAWMVGSMPTAMGSAGSDMQQAMDMSMSGMAGNSSGDIPGYLSAVSIVLACYFTAYTLWLTVRTFGPHKTKPTRDSSCHGIMSLGMAVVLVAVL